MSPARGITPPVGSEAQPAAWRRRLAHLGLGGGVLAILLLALVPRVYLAATEGYLSDEVNAAIPLSQTISFTPGRLHLPLRGENHGALPAYVVKASRSLFGTSPLGTRALHLLLGLVAVWLMAQVAGEWYGARAARWAAALLAFNGYFLMVSSRATAHAPYLALAAVAVCAFSRFLRTERAPWLYVAGAAVGLGFYCKEHAALLLPVFFAALLQAPYRAWLRGPHAYLACGLFALILAPDLTWNLRADPEQARVSYGDQVAGQATYANHFKRIGGLGLSPYPAMFYGRGAVQAVHGALTGRALKDETPEYQAMDPALGLLLVGAVLFTLVRRPGPHALEGSLLLFFCGIFAFFTFIKKGNPPGRLDPVSWIWVEATLLPAVLLTSARLASATGRWRVALSALGGGLLMYACLPVIGAMTGGLMRGVEEARSQVLHVAMLVAAGLVVDVRSRPLVALSLALALGAAVGFACGWFVRGRRR